MPKLKDLSGLRFGRLVVIERDYLKEQQRLQQNKSPKVYWKCICDCKNQTSVLSTHLISGHTTSCGCARSEVTKCTNKKYKKKENKFDLSREYGIGFTSNTNQKFYFDLDDYDKIKNICWYENDEGYVCGILNNKQILLHRFVLGVETLKDKNIIVDHIKHNTLDNRKEYLRITNHMHNSQNRELEIKNKSGVTGVCWKSRESLWIAYITINYKQIILGYFSDFDEAVKVRKQAEEKYFGKYSYDNSMKNY